MAFIFFDSIALAFIFFRSIALETIVYFYRSRAWHVILVISLFQCLYLATLVAGFQGIANGFGWAWAFVAVIAAIGLRLSMPLMVAAYIHAMNAWGWPLAMAALFATGPQIWIWIEQQLFYARLLRSPWPRELYWILLGSLMRLLFFVRLVAGFEGIENGIGFFWAVVAVAALVFLRLDLPLVAGAFFHATNAWSWHPAMAMLFATGLDICVLIKQYMLGRLLKIGR